MTMEHLRPLLESPRDTHLLHGVCQLLAGANVPGGSLMHDSLGKGRRRGQRDIAPLLSSWGRQWRLAQHRSCVS